MMFEILLKVSLMFFLLEVMFFLLERFGYFQIPLTSTEVPSVAGDTIRRQEDRSDKNQPLEQSNIPQSPLQVNHHIEQTVEPPDTAHHNGSVKEVINWSSSLSSFDQTIDHFNELQSSSEANWPMEQSKRTKSPQSTARSYDMSSLYKLADGKGPEQKVVRASSLFNLSSKCMLNLEQGRLITCNICAYDENTLGIIKDQVGQDIEHVRDLYNGMHSRLVEFVDYCATYAHVQQEGISTNEIIARFNEHSRIKDGLFEISEHLCLLTFGKIFQIRSDLIEIGKQYGLKPCKE